MNNRTFGDGPEFDKFFDGLSEGDQAMFLSMVRDAARYRMYRKMCVDLTPENVDALVDSALNSRLNMAVWTDVFDVKGEAA